MLSFVISTFLMSTPNRVSTEADLNLFTSQIAWAGKQLHDNSLVQLVRWVSLQVHGRIVGDKDERKDSPLVDVLLRMLQMESQLQKDAERKLIALMQHTLKTSVPRWKETETPTRDVDWPRTYQRALVQPPTRYQNRVTERVPDAQLMGALVYQARQWRDLLSRASQRYQQRCDALNDAVDALKDRHAVRPGPLTLPLIHRLEQHGPTAQDAARAIRRVFAQQHRIPKPERIRERIRSALEQQDDLYGDAIDVKNKAFNDILEVSVMTAVMRVVDGKAEWELSEISLDGKKFKAVYQHTAHPITVTIGKSPPSSDAYVQIRKSAGMAKNVNPSDGEPDLCLTFTNTGSGESISVMGDAKRNGSKEKEGAGYFRDGLRTATYYMSAYARAMDVTVVDTKNWDRSDPEAGSLRAPTGAIRPTVTLFCRQGTNTIFFTDADDAPGNDQCPPILACDMEQHFGMDSNSEEWSSPFMEGWFDHIANQAVDILG
jgi:hypothetical protein